MKVVMERVAGGSFPAWNEADRLAALRGYEILDTKPEAAFDRIAKAAAYLCRTPIAVINFLDERRQWFKSEIGLGVRETALDVSICTEALFQSGLSVIKDLAADPRFSRHPLVTGKPYLRFYAGALLETDEGLPIGTICVLDTKPHPLGLTQEQSNVLLALARAAMDRLDLRRTGKALRESQRKFGALADAMPQMVWSTRPDGYHDYYNKRWYEFTGVPFGSTDGRRWSGMFHSEDQERVWARWQHSLKTGEDYEIEYRLRHHSGEYRWALGRAVPIRNDGGEIERWFGTCTDIDELKTSQAALMQSEERYRTLMAVTASIVWHASSDGAITDGWSWEALTGQPVEVGRGFGWLEMLHPDDRDMVLSLWKHCVRTGENYETMFRVRHVCGDYRWIQAHATPIRNQDGTIREWIGMLVDIEDRRQSELALSNSEARLRLALQAGRMFAWEIDFSSLTVSYSTSTMGSAGYCSRSYGDFIQSIHPSDREPVEKAVSAAMREAGPLSMEFRYSRSDGATRWLAASGRAMQAETASARLVGVCFDVTERKAAEEQLWRMANHDALTGLPNRTLFHERLEQSIARAQDHEEEFALLIIDLDDFKDVNDTLGHDVGDALIRLIATRLQAAVGESDLVARLGGDEFAVIARTLPKGAGVGPVVDRILDALRQPVRREGRTLSCRASLGIALHPDHGSEAAELMKNADVALYTAKARGRNRSATYDPSLRLATEQRVSLGEAIREGLRNQQFVPFYQPIVCLRSGRIEGFEALARWQHPTKGLLAPGAFALVFEEPDLAAEIGEQMLGHVVRDVRGWLERGLNCGTVALNVSAAEFQDTGFADRILSRLAKADVPARNFKIEVTETVFLGEGTEQVDAALRRLHDAGVQIALDDFGTGYASLTHLKRFPVDQIKIDQSFIRSIEDGSGDDEIVSAVIRMGEGLRMATIAEGIETIDQLRLLRRKACDFGQGYLFAKPMAATRVPNFIEQGWWQRCGDLVGKDSLTDVFPVRSVA